METSPTTKDLQAALSKFQGKAITVQKGSENPAFKRDGKAMKYADLSSILEAVLPALSEVGLSISQFPDGEFGLTTRLMHEKGEWMQATSVMRPTANTPQGIGSTITYARRYALGAILGLITESDDDGHAGSQPQVQQAVAPTPAYATTKQKEEVSRLIGQQCFTSGERTKILKSLNTLTEGQAEKVITKLAWAAQEREEGRAGELKSAE